jgi:parallel beta-helix repeat protein
MLLIRADRTQVRMNEITAMSYVGIDVRDSSNVTLRSNVVSGAADGIFVDASSDRVRVVENLVFDNEDDGIDASGRRVVLRGNTAIENGDYGIVAAPGVIDGGGNLAYDNGNPDQCLNVSCN